MPKSTEPKSGKSKKTEEEDMDVEEQPAPTPKPAPKSKKAKSPKPTEPQPEPQEEEVAEPSPEPAPKKAKKAKKAEPVPEPVPEPEPEPEEEEEEEEEEDEETSRKRKISSMKRKKKAKLVGYRSLARSAGYIDRLSGDTVTTSGVDSISSLLSVADAKRLMRFVPATPGATSFGLDEFSKRHDLFKQGVPASTARETQARCDSALRSVMNQVVLRAAETGKKNVTASMMASILRPYAENMLFTSVVPPTGLIRYAQDEGILSTVEADKKMREDEKKENSQAKKIASEWTTSEEKRLEAARAKRAGATAAA
jgi:hypothetical protein